MRIENEDIKKRFEKQTGAFLDRTLRLEALVPAQRLREKGEYTVKKLAKTTHRLIPERATIHREIQPYA